MRMYVSNYLRYRTLLVSGEVPEHGVVSKQSGLLFEKRLIEKHLQLNSTCPILGTEMSVDDLVEVKGLDVCDCKSFVIYRLIVLLQLTRHLNRDKSQRQAYLVCLQCFR